MGRNRWEEDHPIKPSNSFQISLGFQKGGLRQREAPISWIISPCRTILQAEQPEREYAERSERYSPLVDAVSASEAKATAVSSRRDDGLDSDVLGKLGE
ncbi:hypothetical protein SAMN02745166_02960 [Prosthecobacter debontii]|uniref:Uncharacterized protein n=1 Tax=Prosthecobacter debontii TaxID=48467 RepID=A0A1T4YCL9_9BACT|nr:hypothetical protein SAMN02745166_02960 [Prosthecobacter debontii]